MSKYTKKTRNGSKFPQFLLILFDVFNVKFNCLRYSIELTQNTITKAEMIKKYFKQNVK